MFSPNTPPLDVECNDAQVLEEFASHRKAAPHVRPDVFHTQCSGQCTFWKSKRHRNCYVCEKSHRVHWCGPHCTETPIVLDGSEAHVCPLTHQDLEHSTYIAVPQFDANNRPRFHWGYSKSVVKQPRQKKRQKRVIQQDAIERITQSILVGDDRMRIFQAQTNNAKKTIRKKMKRLRSATMAQVIGVFQQARKAIGCTPPKTVDLDYLGVISKAIHEYMAKHPLCIQGTDSVIVASWLSILSTGIQTKFMDSTIHVAPRVEFVAKYIPPPQLMGMVQGVHCRAISVNTRKFIRYAISDKGNVISNNIFSLPGKQAPQGRHAARRAFRFSVSRPVPLGVGVPEGPGGRTPANR
jgi:hypothetical protein